VLDIVVHTNIRLSSVIAAYILDSRILTIAFHILHHDRTKKLSEPLERLTDWKRLQSLASDLMSPRMKLTRWQKLIKRRATLQLLLVRLSISRIALSELSNDLPDLDHLLSYKKRLRKL
jgi:hypothetical protein